MTGPSLELLTAQLITAWSDWDRACTVLVDRCRKERYRPGARDLDAQTRALVDALQAVAARLDVPVGVLRSTVLTHRHQGATPGFEWTGRPAEHVHTHGTLGRSAPDAVQDAVNDLTPAAQVDPIPQPHHHRRAS